nr:SDR family NAD(P)-dependent oxidoreductase [Aliamphritea spongicola]
MSGQSQQQRVFITAAAQGIGRGIARAFVAAGARVHICDIDQDALNAMAAESDQISCSLTDVGMKLRSKPSSVKVLSNWAALMCW